MRWAPTSRFDSSYLSVHDMSSMSSLASSSWTPDTCSVPRKSLSGETADQQYSYHICIYYYIHIYCSIKDRGESGHGEKGLP